jgi:hypothetical protein
MTQKYYICKYSIFRYQVPSNHTKNCVRCPHSVRTVSAQCPQVCPQCPQCVRKNLSAVRRNLSAVRKLLVCTVRDCPQTAKQLAGSHQPSALPPRPPPPSRNRPPPPQEIDRHFFNKLKNQVAAEIKASLGGGSPPSPKRPLKNPNPTSSARTFA